MPVAMPGLSRIRKKQWEDLPGRKRQSLMACQYGNTVIRRGGAPFEVRRVTYSRRASMREFGACDQSTTTGLFVLREHCSVDPRLRFSHSHQRPNDAGSKNLCFTEHLLPRLPIGHTAEVIPNPDSRGSEFLHPGARQDAVKRSMSMIILLSV
jgi:hypothetical protein